MPDHYKSSEKKVIYNKRERAMLESGKRIGEMPLSLPWKRIEKNRGRNKMLKKNTRSATAKRVAKRVGKTALRSAGPVGVAVGIFDFLKGKPAY
tara:strand:+ start:195 stop:476 length:282 start_codon:yes stop_codon:yes gene_type:complete